MLRLLTCGAALALLLAFGAGCDMVKTWQLEKAVTTALQKDERTRSSDYQVTAMQDGTVTISGEADSGEQIDAVTLVAQAVKGVTKVVNNCSVPEESSGMMQDTVITSPFL
jgi:methionine synthase I (cobalamin-dependent)